VRTKTETVEGPATGSGAAAEASAKSTAEEAGTGEEGTTEEVAGTPGREAERKASTAGTERKVEEFDIVMAMSGKTDVDVGRIGERDRKVVVMQVA
jgi:protein-tyrosine-phosphatase